MVDCIIRECFDVLESWLVVLKDLEGEGKGDTHCDGCLITVH